MYIYIYIYVARARAWRAGRETPVSVNKNSFYAKPAPEIQQQKLLSSS